MPPTTTTTTNGDVGAHLRQRRRRLKLTQVQLASNADVALCTLQNFERGAIPKRSNALPALLAALSRAEAEQDALTPA